MIWEAARATSAAPTFFKRIKIGEQGFKEPFIDGGMGRNNPAACVTEEAEAVFPGREIACLISIGCGQAKTIGIGPEPSFYHRIYPLHLFHLNKIVDALKHIATDCETTAQDVNKWFKEKPDVYFRFNVEQGMQDIEMHDYRRLSEVASHTHHYQRREEYSRKLDVAVRKIGEQGKRRGSSGTLLSSSSINSTH